MKYKDKWSPSKGEAKYDEVTYELRLKNTADKSLDSILVEYCIYHQTTIEEEYMVKIYGKEYGHLWVGYPDTLKKYPEQIVSNTVQGTLSFQDIPDGKEPSALTDSLKLISKAEEVTEYLPAPPHKAGDQGTRNTRTIRGKLLGIRCRVYVPTQDGSYAMKEFSNPSTLLKKTKWVAESLSEEESPREEPKKRKEPISEKKETLTNQKDRAALPATPPLEQPVIKHVMEYRAFTTRNGLKMRARPRGFAESTGSLELELVDGTRRAVELQALSQEDQDFIQDWLTGYSLLSNNQIRFTIRKKTDPGKKITGNLTSLNSMFPNMKYKDHWYAAKGGKEYDEITYELRLENKREKTLFGLVVEYCIYHQTTIQEESKNAFYTDSGGRDENGQYYHYEPSWHSSGNDKYKKHPEETVVNTVKGIIVFSNIAVKESEKEHTDPVRIMERSLERTTYPHKPENKTRGTLNRRTVEGKLLGIRYRVYVPTQDGNYAMVEFSNPSSLKSKTEWVAPE